MIPGVNKWGIIVGDVLVIRRNLLLRLGV